MISLSDTVKNLNARVSQRGSPYYTFKLDDGSGRVTVVSGDVRCPEGSQVAVEGRFLWAKTVSGDTFYNQVDAKRVTCE